MLLHSPCQSSKLITYVLLFKKLIIWAKRRLIGLRNHGRPALIVQDIMEVEVTLPRGDVVNIPTMIMMSLQRNTLNRMSTISVTLPRRRGTTATTAAALVDIVPLVTLQRTPSLPALPGRTPKNHLVALKAGTPHPHREGVVQTLVLPMIAPATQETSLVSLSLVTTMALGDGARDLKVTEQRVGDKILLSH